MGQRLKGKAAVVTGAGRGLGRAHVLALAAEGASVVVNDPGVARGGDGQDASPADEVVAEVKKAGGNAVADYESVADFKAAEKIIRSCVDTFGRIDILVNNAGILREKMVFNMSEEDWDAVVAVHLKGTWNTIRHASPLMKEQKSGRIVNTISAAWLGNVGQCNYAASKGGIVSLTRSVAREMGRYGVTCNAFAPGAPTRMTMTDEVKEGLRKRVEAGIWTQEKYEEFLNMPGPEFVSPMLVYLCLDEAANINGQVIGSMFGKASIYSEPIETKILYKKREEGPFTIDELIKLVPESISAGLVNPAPARPPKDKKA